MSTVWVDAGCPECGSTYAVPPTGWHRKFCSQACAYAARRRLSTEAWRLMRQMDREGDE